MRRDLIIGLLVSLLIHGGAGLLRKSSPPKAKKADEEKVVAIVMPPLEPDEPEKVDKDEDPPPIIDLAPPMQTDVPQIILVDSFVQKLQPPPPESLKPITGVINIPQGIIGAGNRFGDVFDLSQLDQPPTPTFQSKPVYPFEMRRAGITGTVVIGFLVDSTGSVQNVYSVTSTQREFESPAIQAVAKWRFKPGRKGGRNVTTRMQVPIVFSISEE